jgi:SNF2 family DNA or RNA helicase
LRELLGDVMVRHTRSQVQLKLPPRQANTLRLYLTAEESAFYTAVSNYVREHLKQTQLKPGRASLTLEADPGDGQSWTGPDALRQVDRFALLTLQREIGSSPQAAEPTLRVLATRAKDPEQHQHLITLAEQAAALTPWAKADALEKLLHSLLQDPAEKVLIFTHFRRTLDQLAERLRALGISLVVYHGEMDTPAKNQAIDDFEHRAQVLLSTEAAGEGRNLQFCRTMVNFDIPWNPMRIEQRVGRIHRIGQTRPVRIYNLSAHGTIEDYLLEILDQKLNMFELVIGEMDMILGELADERDFEDLLLEIWVQSQNIEALQTGFNQLSETLLQARQAYQKTREYDEALFGEDFVAE